MAVTSTLDWEGKFGTSRVKCYTMTWDGGVTSAAIVPGSGYVTPVGCYAAVTSAAGTFTFSIGLTPRSGSASNIMFLGP